MDADFQLLAGCLPVEQNLRREQAKGRAEHGLFLLAAQAGHELLDHLAQQTIELVPDLMLDGGQQAKVDEIELIGDLRLAGRLGSVDGLRPPRLRVAAEQVRDRVEADALQQPRGALRLEGSAFIS